MTDEVATAPAVQSLLARSNRLGSDRRVTNFAGGNTSAKLVLPDPITGEPTRVLAVKGSGGDLGTLAFAGLALLRLDSVLALEVVHGSGVHEDDIVGYYEFCRFGHGGAVPSIDTPLHAFVDAAHVDHLHPDSMIALACSADGPALVARCYGDRVGWLPWLRPGFELGLALRDFRRSHPGSDGVILGGHGMLCWADASMDCEALSLELIAEAERFISERGRPAPFGSAVRTRQRSNAERQALAVALAPHVRGVAAADKAVVGCFSDAPVVLDFLGSQAAPRLAALGTSCPDHFLRTKVRPLFLDTDDDADLETMVKRLHELHDGYREDYARYWQRHKVASSPAMRGADPAIVLVPGVGMWSFGADPQTARVAGEFYVNAINVMRGAEALSTYAPISDAEKFRVEYWELEERKLQMRPPAPVLQGKVALVTGAGSGIGRAIALELGRLGACVVVADLHPDSAAAVSSELPAERAIGVQMDVSDEAAVDATLDAASRAFGGVDIVVNNAGFASSAPLLDTTTADWDRLHAVLARGSFLVSRAAAKVLLAQRRGGDIVYIASKNGVVAGPSNIAYGAAKADQIHQVRLLAAELGSAAIRVNGVNPDGVVQGSGIFSGDWLAQRSAAYGVEPQNLGQFYASRTLLGVEVLPIHVAQAVVALVDGTLSRTTGLIVPVDGGLVPAFLR